jgi:hypothetical protein
MDHEYPAANPRFADSYLELKDLAMEDAVDVYTMPVEFLVMMGKLGEDSARCLHEYCQGLLLPALGIMEMKRSCEDVTVARIGATERAIKRIRVEVSCEYRLSHGYDIISLGHSTLRISDVTMTSSE